MGPFEHVKKLTLAMCVVGGLATAALAADDSNRVSEEELRQGCDFDRASWEASDPEAIGGCAAQCFKASRIVAEKSHDYRSSHRLALWIGLGVVVLVGGFGQAGAAHIAGRMGARSSRSLLAQGGVLLVALGLGYGAYAATSAMRSEPAGVSVFWDLWRMKHAGKTGASFQGERFMTCGDNKLLARVEAGGNSDLIVFTPFAQYTGTFEDFEQLPTDRAPQSVDLQRRFSDMAKAIASAEEIDAAVTETSPVPFDSGPLRSLRDGLPFPSSYPPIGGLGVVGALMLGLVTRRLMG